jgi:hypothetical protein
MNEMAKIKRCNCHHHHLAYGFIDGLYRLSKSQTIISLTTINYIKK